MRDNPESYFTTLLTSCEVNILVDLTGNSPHGRIACFCAPIVNKDPDSTQPPMSEITHNTRWSAPEVLRGGGPSKESDVYAFAMIMAEVRYGPSTMHQTLIYHHFVSIQVFTNQVPFGNTSDPPDVLTIIAGERPPRPTHPSCTDNLWSLMKRCWDQSPHSRPDASEASQILDPLVLCLF